MAYNAFTLERVQTDFGIVVETHPNLFGSVPPALVPNSFRDLLREQYGLAIAVNTEKARSELAIAPILTEVWRRGGGRVALFSGVTFNVDPAADLSGVCDYILGRPPQLDFVSAPVMMIAEAKNESVAGGLGQCAAAMIAAQRFNLARKSDITTIYGCVTDGGEWKFLRLHGAALDIDLNEHLISEPDRILGILLHAVGIAPTAAAA